MRFSLGLALAATASWMASGQSTAPKPRWGHSAALLGSSLYIVGGRSGTSGSKSPLASDNFVVSIDTSQSFNTESPPWIFISTPGDKPNPVTNGALQADASHKRLMLFGGDLDGHEGPSDAVWTFNPVQRTWKLESRKEGPEPRRAGAAVASDGTYIYTYGGVDGEDKSQPEVFDDMYKLSKNSFKWSKCKNATGANSALSQHTLSYVVKQKKFVSIGGANNASLASMNKINWYNPEKDTWGTSTARGSIPLPRRAHSSVVVGERIIVFGGCSFNYSTFYNDVAVLDTTTFTWSKPTVKNAPEGRYEHSATMVGNYMIVAFGFLKGNKGDGNVYALNTKTWAFESNFPKSGGSSGTLPDSQPDSQLSEGLGAGTIAGIVLACITVPVLIGVTALFYVRRSRAKKQAQLEILSGQKNAAMLDTSQSGIYSSAFAASRRPTLPATGDAAPPFNPLTLVAASQQQPTAPGTQRPLSPPVPPTMSFTDGLSRLAPLPSSFIATASNLSTTLGMHSAGPLNVDDEAQETRLQTLARENNVYTTVVPKQELRIANPDSGP
ncbi:hypothetical protein THASP1DRAFT_22848 [Thamnocephalis sphaerospora]|uniref:Galactose oxidase n=1 Tax=Thamnocephalis sphaerospora TaxID=78915 RepID=A0A4P9XTH2_9FUNG|nr:hypothetical protein THASP1DRAFT_22848 [Thamnocephalis sphaerospora]|eukprot:RKP09292.1 hypothetical protein THASP1DRAFT_22848 [Thamnocephalis sphaerospora]